MSPRPPPSKPARRLRRWLIPAALFALAPKCVLCVLAYAGLGAALGLGGPEMCGAPAGENGSWTTSLVLAGLAVGAGVFLAGHRPGRCFRTPTDSSRLR